MAEQDAAIDPHWVPLQYNDRCAARKTMLDQAAAELVSVARSVGGVVAVYAFGSYALDKVGPDSDLDPLIVRETDLPRINREDDIRAALRSVCGFDLLVIRPDEFRDKLPANSVGRRILSEAKLLYAV